MAFGFGKSNKTAPAQDERGDLHLFAIKAATLNELRMDAGVGNMPTLEDYRLAFMSNMDVQAMVADGLIKPENLNAIAADLSGQNLNGFKLTEPKAQQEFERARTASGAHDLLDQDGNGQIEVEATAPFYDRLRLDGASLEGAWVEPASSFNDQIAKARNRDHMTFHGLADGETFTFPPGESNDIRVTGIDGGVIAFAQGAVANGVTLEGREASVSIDRNASVSGLTPVDNFRIVRLDMEPGATLANSDLRNALVSMSSELRGTTLRDVKLGENVTGLDLSGATLHNLSIGGKPITSAQQLEALGVHVDARTTVSAEQNFVANMQMEAARAAAANVIDAASWAIAAAPSQPLTLPNLAALQIGGGDKVADLSAALATGAGAKVADLARPTPAPGQEVAVRTRTA